MEIKARCRFDLDTVRALYHLSLFRKHNPAIRMMVYTVTFCILIAILIFEGILWGFSSKIIVALCVGVFTLLLLYFFYYLAPIIRFRRWAKVNAVENLYIFGDDTLKVSSVSEEYNGESAISYTFFVRSYETSKYFYLFETDRQTFVIDKSTIEGGTAEDIRAKLTAFLGDKCIRCKY